jgi:hypothetical protein
MKFEFSKLTFWKYSNFMKIRPKIINFHENPSENTQISLNAVWKYISWKSVWKYSNFMKFRRKILKFHENPSNESRIFPDGRTDRYDEANSHFSHFAKAP